MSQFKNDLLVVKAIFDMVKEIYDTNKMQVLNELLASDKPYKSTYGKFYTQINTNKMTAQELIIDRQKKIEKLQEEIKELQKHDKNEVMQEETYKLMSKHDKDADTQAEQLLKDLLKQFNSAKIQKAQKIIRK